MTRRPGHCRTRVRPNSRCAGLLILEAGDCSHPMVINTVASLPAYPGTKQSASLQRLVPYFLAVEWAPNEKGASTRSVAPCSYARTCSLVDPLLKLKPRYLSLLSPKTFTPKLCCNMRQRSRLPHWACSLFVEWTRMIWLSDPARAIRWTY